MGFWTKMDPAEPEAKATTQPVRRDGKALPGIAGYRGTATLAKNAMPDSRFTYVRPDGKP
jgi:hypothetical protein